MRIFTKIFLYWLLAIKQNVKFDAVKYSESLNLPFIVVLFIFIYDVQSRHFNQIR